MKPEPFLWAAAGVVALLLDSSVPQVMHDRSQPFTAALIVALGVRIFWTHGGQRITAAGLFSLASVMFAGYAGLYWWQQGAATTSLYMATTACFWSLLAMWALFWQGQATVRSTAGEWQPPPPSVTGWLITVGLVINATASIAWVSGFRIGVTFVQEIAFAGMAMLMVGLVLHRSQKMRPVRRLAIAAVAVLVFSETTFSGYGRLILVSLALVPTILASWITESRRVKMLMLLGIAPALAYLSRMREQFGITKLGAEMNGIGSVVEPLRDFGRLVTAHQAGGYDLVNGDTFWAALVVWVPRELWADKPLGFGVDITRVLEPELLAIGQSMAALSQGEWYFNFGWVGIPLMVVTLGYLIRRLDAWALTRREVADRRDALLLVVALLLAAGIPNLMWVGTFGYTSRTLLRLGVIVALLVVWGGRRRQRHAAASTQRSRLAARGPGY